MVIVAVVAAILLVCIGALLGATCTTRVLQPRLHQRARQHAEERRMLAKEWAALRPHHGECPRCSNPLSEWDDHLAPTVVPD
ncbi:MAG: hypothetical protein ACRDS0_08790 [Pseudonocardiaceae bacterium]